MKTIAGTPYFISPEVLQEDYGPECDIWSLGVVLYMLLTGKYPFDGANRADVFTKISIGKFKRPDNCSDECWDLLKKLICVDREKRLTGDKAIEHAWFKKFDNDKGNDS